MNPYLEGLRCLHCDTRFPATWMAAGCPACRTDTFASGLTAVYDYERLRHDLADGPLAHAEDGVWRYRRLLPGDERHEVTLGEGGTPLVSVPSLARELEAEQVWLKDESRNPTWTFKDRNAAVTVSKALEFGARTVVVSTSGNHGASVAAYAARARLECVVLTYPGVAETTRRLIESFGARLVVTDPEDRWQVMREGIADHGWFAASNYTDVPTSGAYGHEGYKTISFEVAEALGGVPDLVSVPNAYGEGLFGIWKGFEELQRLGRATTVPRLLACEPAGGPLARAFASQQDPIARVARTSTVARGIGGAINSYASVVALAGSAGLVAQASDPEIVTAQRSLAAEGLAVEPASAAAVAGLRRMRRDGRLRSGQRIVVVSTSSMLKSAPSRGAAGRGERDRANDTKLSAPLLR